MVIQSENMSPEEFIRAVLERDARKIYRAQKLIVSEGIWKEGRELKAKKRGITIQKRTGKLEDALANPDFIIQSQGESFTIAANYPLYIRFLDMKHLKDMRLYNRQIWGVLLNNALKDIRFNYGKTIADRVGDALREAFPSTPSSGRSASDKGFDGAEYANAKGR